MSQFEIKTIQQDGGIRQTVRNLYELDRPDDDYASRMGYRAQKSMSMKNGTPVTWTQMPDWVDLVQGSKLRGTEGAYSAVPLFFRALNLRCSALTSIPTHVEETVGGKITEWPFPTPLEDLLADTEAGQLLFGHSEWLKKGVETALGIGNLALRQIKDVEWLHTRYSIPWYDPARDLVYFSYSHPGPLAGRYDETQLVYFREFNAMHKKLPGPGAGMVALENLGLTHYLTHFAKSFFEGGAMPVVFVGVDGPPTSDDEAKRIQGLLNRMMGGVEKAFKIIFMRSKVNAQIITPPFKDMEMPGLFDQAQQEVGKAFQIPQTLLDEATNKSSGNDDERHFYQDTIIPRAKRYAAKINRDLLGPAGLKLVFDVEELPIMQEDAATRARSYYFLRQGEIPTDVAMEIAGYRLAPDQWDRIKQHMVASSPISKEAITVDDKGNPAPPAVGKDQAAPMTPAMTKDLNLWHEISVRNFKKGKGCADDFECKALPAEMAEPIRAKLKAATTEDEIDCAFEVKVAIDPILVLANELKLAREFLQA